MEALRRRFGVWNEQEERPHLNLKDTIVNIQFSDLLGNSLDVLKENQLVNLYLEGKEGEQIGDRFYVTNKKEGIGFVFDSLRNLIAIHFHSGTKSYNIYTGLLPYKIDFKDSIDRVHQKIGLENFISGGGEILPILGASNLWRRYDYDKLLCSGGIRSKGLTCVDYTRHTTLGGSQFDGPGEQINYVPMKGSINRNGGTYYQMEREWNVVLNNQGTITNVEWEIIYNIDKRPTIINVTATVNEETKFIYSESKLGTGVLSKQQEMLTEMIKTGNFKAEIRSASGLITQTSNFGTQGSKISFDQINLFKGQSVGDITQPIVNWTK